MHRVKAKIFIILLFCLVAVAQAQTNRHNKSKSNHSKKAGHRRIVAKEHSDDYMDGTASFYARKFAGRKTTSGRRLDMSAFTAAHPTLPMGTKLKVTNLSNDKVVYVEVNDRMPSASGHVLDLTTAGARQIGINGIGKVHLEVIDNGIFQNVANGEISKALISANPLLSESQAISIANQYTVSRNSDESNNQTAKDSTN